MRLTICLLTLGCLWSIQGHTKELQTVRPDVMSSAICKGYGQRAVTYYQQKASGVLLKDSLRSIVGQPEVERLSIAGLDSLNATQDIDAMSIMVLSLVYAEEWRDAMDVHDTVIGVCAEILRTKQVEND